MNQTVQNALGQKEINYQFGFQISALSALVERIAGKEYADAVVFEKAEGDFLEEEFVLSDDNGKIKIIASSGSAAAVGFNTYLKKYCKVTVGALFTTGSFPENPPQVTETLRRSSPFAYRYLFNYCTFGYTYAFYSKEDWIRVLDWAALSGYNLLLNPLGQETVWLNFLMKLGYTKEEAKDFLVGPASMPWFLMMNMSSFDGNYPDWWFEERKELAGWFNIHLQSLGIATVLPGYCGMVPDDFSKRFSQCEVLLQGTWSGYARPSYLLSKNEMFAYVAKKYYETQAELAGAESVHYYSTDPFHEGGICGDIDLAEYGLDVYRAMSDYDEKAVWCFQAWQENPKREILQKLDRSKVLVMNLMGEKNFDGGDNFADSPWIYCAVNNFGGQHVLRGNATAFLNQPFDGLKDRYNLVGIGLMPEAVETDEVFFDIVSEISFSAAVPDLNNYLKDFIERRYGYSDGALVDAWHTLLTKVYVSDLPYAGDESAFCCRPSLSVDSVSSWGGHSFAKDPKPLMNVVKTLLKYYVVCSSSKAYLYDLVDFTRQLFGNDSWRLVLGMQNAIKLKDKRGFAECADAFLYRYELLEELLTTHESFLLGPRVAMARNLGKDRFEKRWFEKNARRLYTLWAGRKGDELHDYAAREYAEMVSQFYRPRWEAFISYWESNFAVGSLEEPIDFREWEWPFSFDRKELKYQPCGDIKQAVSEILKQI